ncbi:Lambda phage protein with carbohydrate-binding module [Shewanella oneidensis]|uniref:Lambda phage protein with carbohydrate-binding module n=1 Tax=Shewanella oneidensis (strain ATCC 700550 / JCM 31522 / CIP 106686 / LMG 19005 / NCIMB 14063 / MR-1) TaxID=211586 RepID=Q8ED25_SHEON|nr:Lambda phage protein with carbohydrate-binding module [Shewanella oneidensis MR-1]MEE2027471.1 hypothetical protein [Shewanella oneidensis]
MGGSFGKKGASSATAAQVPLATETTPGLMSPSEKLKLSTLTTSIATSDFYASYDFMMHSIGLTSANNISLLSTGNISLQNILSEGNHFGVQPIVSSTTANASFLAGMLMAIFPKESELEVTVYFKTPSAFNPAQLTVIGSTSIGLGISDRSGLIIENGNAFGGIVKASAATETGSTYALSTSTWYICKFKMLTDDRFKVTLYSDSGTQLYSYTSTAAMFRADNATAHIGFKTQCKTATAGISLISIDLIEFKAKVSATRAKV